MVAADNTAVTALAAAMEAMRTLSPDFHPIEMPPVIFNRLSMPGPH